MEIIDLNKFYTQWCEDPQKTKLEMVNTAAREIFKFRRNLRVVRLAKFSGQRYI